MIGNKQTIARRSLVLAALVAFAFASGCSGKREHAEEVRPTGDAPRSERPAPSEPAPTGAAVVDSAGSVDELFSRIHTHESEISQAIAAGRLDEVGREALLIRDLTVTATGLADVPVDQRASLELHVSTVKRVAADLSAAGKAGDLIEIKARNSEFQKELGTIERMIGQARG